MKRGYTTCDEYNIIYEWKIDKIDRFIDNFNKNADFILFSPKFSTGAKINDEWQMRLNIFNIYSPYDYLQNSKMTITLCSLSDTNKINIKCSSCKLMGKLNGSLFTSKKERSLLSKDETVTFDVTPKDFKGRKYEYLPNNTLTFCLDLTVYGAPVSTSTELELNIPKRQMIHDYTELYNTKMNSDVIINVRNKEFRAHKTILMARSTVFTAMFSHDMIEKKQNKISIPDITPEIFEKILMYLYTDQVTNLDADADRLLEAADKYQLQFLKEVCQESLSKTLTVENALKIMTLADRHSAKHLLEFTNKFMTSNINKIIETQYFKEFKKSNPSAALAVLEKFMICNKGD